MQMQKANKDVDERSLKERLLRFGLAVGGLVLVVFLARYPIKLIPAFNEYAEAADRYGLHPGALYYSDVPVTLEAELHNRSAVKAVDDRHREDRAKQKEESKD